MIPPYLSKHERIGPLTVKWLGKSIMGHAVKIKGIVYVVTCEALHPGNGNCGRWIKSLDSRVRFAAVTSEVLAGMLSRRGYAKVTITDPEIIEAIDSWWPEWQSKLMDELGVKRDSEIEVWARLE